MTDLRTKRAIALATIAGAQASLAAGYDAATEGGWCIVGTRIVCDVLGHFGVRVRPLSVTATFFSEGFVELSGSTGGRLPETREELVEWTDRPGVWSVGLGLGEEEPGRWPGHLVALVEDRLVVDISAGQASRPERGLVVPGVLSFEVPRAFVQGKVDRPLELDDGGVVVYRVRSGDKSFQKSRAWKRPDRRADAVLALVRLIERRAEEEAAR